MAGKSFFKVLHSDIDAGVYKDWTKAELLVWMVLKRHENKDGISFPGFRRIHRMTNLSSRSITRAIGSLAGRGVVLIYR